jgi:transposase
VIGYDESEQLDVEPARYFVRVTKREKRACRCCQAGTVTMAPLAPLIVEKGLASDRVVVVETVVAKYSDHLPLYRQAAMLERDAGLEIGRATLDGWVMRVGELLEPVVAVMRQGLLRESYLQADETIVSGADARQTRSGSPSVLMAIRQAGRRNGIRFPHGARPRGSTEILGPVGGHLTNRWVSSLRRRRRAETRSRGLLGARPA